MKLEYEKLTVFDVDDANFNDSSSSAFNKKFGAVLAVFMVLAETFG